MKKKPKVFSDPNEEECMSDGRVFHQHWITVLLPASVGLLSLSTFICSAVASAVGRVPWLIPLLPGLGLFWAGWRLLEWRAYRLIFTGDGRLVCYRGLMRQQINVPLFFSRVVAHPSGFGRVLNFGTLVLHGQPSYRFDYVERFDEVQRILEEGRSGQMAARQDVNPVIIVVPVDRRLEERRMQLPLPSEPPIARPYRMMVDGEYRVLEEVEARGIRR